MILYHGSNVAVELPRLLKGRRPLDFGPGFYTTSDRDQAVKWAERTARIRQDGTPLVSVYEVDACAFAKLKALTFDATDKEWLRFVAANRRRLLQDDGWDVVSGPVANDQTMPTLMLFLDGFLSEDEAIARLLPQKLKDQHVFKTDAALAALRCTGVEAL